MTTVIDIIAILVTYRRSFFKDIRSDTALGVLGVFKT